MRKNLNKILVFVWAVIFLTVGTNLAFAASQTVVDSYTDQTKINPGLSSYYSISSGNYSVGSAANVGNGADGAITVAVGTTKNINTDILAVGRSYADGVVYAVSSISTSSVVTSSTPNGIAAGDEVILINMMGDATNYGNVGNYEFFRVASVNGTTINFWSSISKIYGATNSNSVLTGQKVIVQRVPNYTNVTVSSTAVFTSSAWNGTTGGLIAFRANGTVSVVGSISESAYGYRGGTGAGESYDGKWGTGGVNQGAEPTRGGGRAASQSTVAPVNGVPSGAGGAGGNLGTNDTNGAGGGGGGAYGTGGGGGGGGGAAGGSGGASGGSIYGGGGGGACYGNCTPGAGGNAGYAGASGANGYENGLGGAAGTGASQGGGGGGCADFYRNGGGGGGGTGYGSATLTKLYMGSGGGAGGSSGGAGGAGGGIVYLGVSSMTVSGSILSRGGAGGTSATHSGAGGGGAGGSIYIEGSSLTLGSSLVSATGGAGASSNPFFGGGGGGGVGRIRISSTTLSGTTSPTASTATLTAYSATSVLVSTDLLNGLTVNSADSITYNLSAKPASTTALMQYSTDLSSWYSGAGVLDGSDTLLVGTNSATLSGIPFTQPFYYKITFTSNNGVATPVMADLTLNYSSDISCDPLPSGNHTIFHSCSFSTLVNGADYGTNQTNSAKLLVKSGTLTVNSNQVVATGSLEMTGGSLALAQGGQILLGTPIWMVDADADGYPSNTTQYAQVNAPTNGRRRSAMTSIGTPDCSESVFSTVNICCAQQNYYRDADGDTYGNPNISVYQCSPAPSGYVSNNTDCYDSNANAKPGSAYCGTVNRGDGSFDYNCGGTQVACGTVYNVTTVSTPVASGWGVGSCTNRNAACRRGNIDTYGGQTTACGAVGAICAGTGMVATSCASCGDTTGGYSACTSITTGTQGCN